MTASHEESGAPTAVVFEETPPPVHPLLRPNSDQRHLLEVIARGHDLAAGDWPVFQYVDSVLFDGGLDAAEVMLTCPRVGNYGWFQISHGSHTAQPEDKIALTVAGLAQVPGCVPMAKTFLKVLECLVDAERSVRPSPTMAQPTTISSEALLAILWERHSLASSPRDPEFILGQVKIEPSTWQCGIQLLEPSRWVLTLTPALRRFAGLKTVEAYVERLVDHLSPPLPAITVRPSGLALPEAIDYLNLAWRVLTKHPLFRVPQAEGAAKLSYECAGPEEFDSRLSGLCTILGRVELPGETGSKLTDLDDYLKARLCDEAADRSVEAVKDLRAFLGLRAWRQHGGEVGKRGHDAMRRLGLQLPASNWGDAWAKAQARCVAALNAIREEVEAVTGDD